MGNLPVNPVVFALVGLVIFLWLRLVIWVSADARAVGESQVKWNSIAFAIGSILTLLTILIHPVVAIFMAIALLAFVASYATVRNKRVPEGERLFTAQHLQNWSQKVLRKLGVSAAQPVQVKTEGPGPEIILMKKDGTPMESASKRQRKSIGQDAILTSKEIIEEAIKSRATDIHIEPKGEQMQIRYRIDGILHNAQPVDQSLGLAVISALKVLANMDIAEKRKAQDGDFAATLGERYLDFRVATSSSLFGETMAIRILDKTSGLMRMADLGMSSDVMAKVREITHSKSGMLVVAGPTGSGKTTSLYAAIGELDAFRHNIMTIEEPIEYQLENVTQMAINPKAGITYPTALKALLRQDPDIIMVGEIRDQPTAKIALQSALTGHFVFTTLHANDSVTSIFRLLDLGVEAYLISSALKSVLAQRLIRVLCKNCKVPYRPNPEFLKKLGLPAGKVEVLYKSKGCEKCLGTGYRGRTGIFELLNIDDTIREMVRRRPSFDELKAAARKAGMRSVQEDGLRKAVQGITSLREVARVAK